MKIAELEAGGVYTWKNGSGRYGDWNVGVLLSTDPWKDNYGRPCPVPAGDPIGRVRTVPVMDLQPIVTLADGTEHVMRFGPHLHVHQTGWVRGGVRPAQLSVVAVPVLVSISHIARRVG